MVTGSGNQANPFRTHKVKVFWQGPYEVVGGSGPTAYRVRLLGDTDESEVHWRKLRRLAGPELTPDEEVVASALHDRQRFKVQSFDDWIVDEGEAELLVRWQHHGEDERTWEPLLQLLEDVPKMVQKYVQEVDSQDLTGALEEAEAAVAVDVPDAKDKKTAAEAASKVTGPTPEDTPDDAVLRADRARAARDARAAARANRS